MIVTKGGIYEVIAKLRKEEFLALDCETTGLRMYHGDRLFSIILATETEAYYFNFHKADFEEDEVLTWGHMQLLEVLWQDKDKTWFIQNAANFDMGILIQEGIELAGTIHCTKAIGRVEYNNHLSYSLKDQLKRLGGPLKDDKVMAYVKAEKLHTEIPLPGKDTVYKKLHFDKVPKSLIVPYAEDDAKGTFFLGKRQIESIKKQDLAEPSLPKERSLQRVMEQERRLQKTIFRMRHHGVKVDIPYCERAIKYEKDRAEKAMASFKAESGRDYVASSTLFATIFEGEKSKWGYTDKGNPSFDSEYLGTFEHPAARAILEIRDAKSKSDFYNGFLWFADSRGIVHPNYNPEGTVHGRFSSAEPNFQNLTSEDSEEELAQEFIVRRAIVPRSGNKLLSIDMNTFEYRFMLELACKYLGRKTPLAELVLKGLDFHEATIENTKRAGSTVTRKQAKIANFLTLYGGGVYKLAEALGIPHQEALKIRRAIFSAAPEIAELIHSIQTIAETRGYVINWLGRRCYFPNKRFSYRAPNYVVSGGTADCIKKAMTEIDELLLNHETKMVMTIHDELVFEVPEKELHLEQQLISIMANAYKSTYIPLTASSSWSDKSLGDLQ